jgi:glucose/arabinose dehydrogenase
VTARCSSPLGERFQFIPAQDLSNTLGKIVRINPDGSIPKDNPFVGRESARPEIWSYGHRNAQGAAIHRETGKLWEAEFGPMGGDCGSRSIKYQRQSCARSCGEPAQRLPGCHR